MNRIRMQNALILSGIFLFNFAFKLVDISDASLWYDEIISVKDTFLEFGHIKHEAEWDKNPPFYHYVLWVWCKIFGVSEMAVRAMSVLFSSLSGCLLYWMLRRHPSRVYAVAVVVIYTFHPFLFYYAQEARCYTLLFFLVLLSINCAQGLLRDIVLWRALLLGIINFLIFYTHYVAALALVCQFFYLAYQLRANIKALLVTFLTPLVLIAVRFTPGQYRVLFFSGDMSREKQNVPLSSEDSLWEAFSDLYVAKWMALLLIAAIGVAFLRGWGNKNELSLYERFLMLSGPLCFLLLFIVGIFTNVFGSRYLIFSLAFTLPACLLFSKRKSVVIIVTAFVLCFEVSRVEFGKSKGTDYRLAASLIHNLREEQIVRVVLQTHDLLPVFLYYYDQSAFISYSKGNAKVVEEKNISSITTGEQFKEILEDSDGPIVLFQTFDKPSDNLEIAHSARTLGFLHIKSNAIEGVTLNYFIRK